MIKDKYKQHVCLALKAIKDCAKIDKNKKVSYSVTYEYEIARMILDTMVRPKGLTENESKRCLKKAIEQYVLADDSAIDEFKKLIANEVRKLAKTSKSSYLVIRSAHTNIPVELKNRRLFNVSISTSRAYEADGRLISFKMAKPFLKAVESRKALLDISNEEYFPNHIEGRFFISGRAYASDTADAKYKAGLAIESYLALLNFLMGFGRGHGWDINPQQPLGAVVPNPYTTIHKSSGHMIENCVYYDPGLTLIRTSGKSISQKDAKKIDHQIDFVLKQVKKHFDSESIWDGIRLLGQAYSSTDKNIIYLKSWMALEKLMYFQASESHDKMLGRMKFLLSNEKEKEEKALLECLRLTRNHLAHQGLDINDSVQHPFFNPTSALIEMVNRLIHFHLHVPRVIKSKEDFIQYTSMPLGRDSLIHKQELTRALLDWVNK